MGYSLEHNSSFSCGDQPGKCQILKVLQFATGDDFVTGDFVIGDFVIGEFVISEFQPVILLPVTLLLVTLLLVSLNR